MATSELQQENTYPTLPLDTFWGWLSGHPNCILRAGTPESVVYDDDSFHWVLAAEGDFLLAQMIRGKRLITELFIQPEQISYVQGSQGEREGEFIFELIAESEQDRVTAAFFVLCHGLDDDDTGHVGAVH